MDIIFFIVDSTVFACTCSCCHSPHFITFNSIVVACDCSCCHKQNCVSVNSLVVACTCACCHRHHFILLIQYLLSVLVIVAIDIILSLLIHYLSVHVAVAMGID